MHISRLINFDGGIWDVTVIAMLPFRLSALFDATVLSYSIISDAEVIQ